MNDVHASSPADLIGLFVVDADWRVTEINDRGAQLLRRDGGRLVGKRLWDEYPDALTADFGRMYRTAMANREPVAFEAFYPPLGTWFDVRAFPRDDGGLAVHFTTVGQVDAAPAERARLLAAEREARLVAEAAQDRLSYTADHDLLTGLANRGAALRWLDSTLKAGITVTVLLCDLNDFKRVNDGMGHACGDHLLREMADRLRALAGPPDLVARVGSNEYVLALIGRSHHEVIEPLLAAFSDPVHIEGRRLVMTVSVGIADSRITATRSGKDLLREADIALYRAKARGHRRVATYDRELHRQVADRLVIEADLRSALERDELHLAFQPVFDALTGRVCGCEALSRWDHPTRGAVTPGTFIPVAEASGLIVPLGERVLRTAADLLHDVAARLSGRPFTLWVNVSGRQLLDPSFVPVVEAVIEGVEHLIGFEITETVLLDDPAAAVAQLGRLSDLGVRLALDDFGTGYSSLSRVTSYPIDVIKIDQSFVARIESAQHRAVVVAIVELAHAFGARTVAEGVETPEQLRILREVGCDELSGYLLSCPVPRHELREAARRGGLQLHQDRLPLEWRSPPA